MKERKIGRKEERSKKDGKKKERSKRLENLLE